MEKASDRSITRSNGVSAAVQTKLRMQLQGTHAPQRVALLSAAARELALTPGSEVVARVAAAPRGDSRGLLALAGMLLEARLPEGVAEGQTLRLTVAEAEAGRLTLRLVKPPSD